MIIDFHVYIVNISTEEDTLALSPQPVKFAQGSGLSNY